MAIEIRVPSPGESITQVQLAKWLVGEGELVEKDQEVVEIDSDKASFPIASPEDGIIRLKSAEGDTISVGAVIAIIEPSATGHAAAIKQHASPAVKSSGPSFKSEAEPAVTKEKETNSTAAAGQDVLHASPLARKIIEEEGVKAIELAKAFPGKKITRSDVEDFIKGRKPDAPSSAFSSIRKEERKKLSTLRLKLAERLVAVKNQTAMLTTFNEINMTAALKLKDTYSEVFKQKYGVGIGLMSLFAKAVTIALQDFPQVNSMIDGEELVSPGYVDIGIAVSAPKGLVVPVIRNAEALSLAGLEIKVKEYAVKARDGKLSIDDMKGGTFTITNGGVFGSLMSTPILNPPQSAILGMHKIMDRPIAVERQVIVAPMMYVALSYDHRVIDGKDSVGFLIKVKELVEDPLKMLTMGEDPVTLLLDL
ncbi:MAG: 2-oxoglutarate dehydrogenase complex dihydrolipoyllysine-residue succinyltransferase [Bacteroidetes bacterium]|nr:2-oxoglutarate dehydrogenase complex dihydrolipoyllysine-residue succinyltransferase [Bacteroidota bacterium]